jgi:hypothetical protein
MRGVSRERQLHLLRISIFIFLPGDLGRFRQADAQDAVFKLRLGLGGGIRLIGERDGAAEGAVTALDQVPVLFNCRPRRARSFFLSGSSACRPQRDVDVLFVAPRQFRRHLDSVFSFGDVDPGAVPALPNPPNAAIGLRREKSSKASIGRPVSVGRRPRCPDLLEGIAGLEAPACHGP